MCMNCRATDISYTHCTSDCALYQEMTYDMSSGMWKLCMICEVECESLLYLTVVYSLQCVMSMWRLSIYICWTAAARWCFVFHQLTDNCSRRHHLPSWLHYRRCHSDIDTASNSLCLADTVNLSVMLSDSDSNQWKLYNLILSQDVSLTVTVSVSVSLTVV